MNPHPTIQRQIESILKSICERDRIRLLHACESGSRAWGFASPDSDYDVRLIFCREEKEYLRVFDHHDGFEEPFPGDVDLSGWDLRKTLRLIAKSNAVVYEWLQSPIVYGGDPQARSMLWSTAVEFFSPRSCIRHYLGTVRSSLATIDPQGIGIKKYFYVLRPLLAAYWIAEKQTVPPMEFGPLQAMLEPYPSIQAIIDELLAEKALSVEKRRIPLRAELQDFIASIHSRCETTAEKLEPRSIDSERLDTVFRTLIASQSHM